MFEIQPLLCELRELFENSENMLREASFHSVVARGAQEMRDSWELGAGSREFTG